MKISLLAILAFGLASFGCSKKSATMTEQQAREAGYVVAVTNNGVSALLPDHIMINGTNVPVSSTNVTIRPIKKN